MMAMTQKIALRQGQNLIMTPQLQQAIKILELSHQDLAAYVEQQLERNPLLEKAEEMPPSASSESTGNVADQSRAEAHLAQNPSDEPEANYKIEMGHVSFQEENYSGAWRASYGGEFTQNDNNEAEENISRKITLREHLEAQVNFDISGSTERMIALQLIDMVNDSGYIIGDLTALSARLGCNLSETEAALRKVQEFDPVGVCARDLRECLALQLKEKDRLDPAMKTLLDNLDLVARNDRAALVKLCAVDEEDIADMIKEIRALNPRPGSSFDHSECQIPVPDILLNKLTDGGWVVALNPDTLPRILVNQGYYATLSGQAKDGDGRDFIDKKLAEANWLLKALDQRANTLLRVAKEIVQQQESFFLYGVQRMRPLTRRDIAAAISMHESTVSRVIANKCIATPRGFFELRYFFNATIQGHNETVNHAAEAVRSQIKMLIQEETPDDVLSDDRLAEILHQRGINIARRTVAKYRESLKILSSAQRRRAKGLHVK